VTSEGAADQSSPEKLRAWVVAQAGWRRHALAFFAGSLSVLAFAPFFVSPVLFLTLPVLVWLIDSASTPKAAAVSGWSFGFGFFFFGLFWIGEAFLVEADKFAWLLPFAVTLLPAGLALFWAAAAGASRRIWPQGLARVIALAIVLSLAEWLRGNILTGLPWNILGYALTYPDALMQSAGLFGIYGLTLLAVAIFSSPLVILADAGAAATARTQIKAVALAVVPLLAMWAYGAWKLSKPLTYVDGVKIRIVQPSVLQSEKWQPEFQRRIFDDHIALSKTNRDGKTDNLDGITHLIWPEAAMPFLPLETPQALSAIAEFLPADTSLITGALRRALPTNKSTASTPQSVEAFNSILVFNSDGQLSATYDKIHLVPFGEYLPMESLLSVIGLDSLTFGRGAFTPGPTPRHLLDIAKLPPVLGLVCYEALFPSEIAIPSGGYAGAIINVTNDGWFGNSTGPRQHFHQTRVRAVEQGMPILRSANNGISGVIDPYGRILASIGMNERGVIDSRLPAAIAPSPYALFGETAFALLLVIIAAAAYALRRNPRL
jgi:apolipoprotein N-acyltransferase